MGPDDGLVTSESAAPELVEGHIAVGDKGLKAGALGYLSNIVIGVASTAPAYSLAATLGFIVAVKGVGVHAPGVLIAAFVPMLFVALGYKYLNHADPDCGTTFAWTTRAFGPYVGWINGWAHLRRGRDRDGVPVGDRRAVHLPALRLERRQRTRRRAIIIGAVIWIALMTWICYRGIELSARTQVGCSGAEIVILAAFSIVALVKVYTGHPAGSMHVSASWFNPFTISFSALADGVLLGIFIYWGWDSGVSVNEESEESAEGPGRAAVVSTLLLVVIYVIVSTAAQAFAGTGTLDDELERRAQRARHGRVRLAVGQAADHRRAHLGLRVDADDDPAHRADDAVDGPLGRDPEGVRKRPSALPHADRVDARDGRALDRVDVLLVALNPAQNVLGDSITALGFSIGFYYGFTGLRICAWYFRHDLFTQRPALLPRRAAAAGRRAADVRRLREGVPRLQPHGIRLLDAVVGDPDSDRDRDRDAAAGRTADGDLRGQVPAVLPAPHRGGAGRAADNPVEHATSHF